MKNDRTPRTLADCDFSVGHPDVEQPASPWVTLLYVLACIACMAAIGVELAWRG